MRLSLRNIAGNALSAARGLVYFFWGRAQARAPGVVNGVLGQLQRLERIAPLTQVSGRLRSFLVSRRVPVAQAARTVRTEPPPLPSPRKMKVQARPAAAAAKPRTRKKAAGSSKRTKKKALIEIADSGMRTAQAVQSGRVKVEDPTSMPKAKRGQKQK